MMETDKKLCEGDESVLLRQCAILNETLSIINRYYDELRERLHPVMNDIPDETQVYKMDKLNSTVSPLEFELMMINSRIRDLVHIVTVMRDKINL